MKVGRLSALGTRRLYARGDAPGTHFCYRLNRLQGHSAAGRFNSMINIDDLIDDYYYFFIIRNNGSTILEATAFLKHNVLK